MRTKTITQEHEKAMSRPIDPEEISKIQREQQELIDAYRAKHRLDPEDIGVEVRNYGQGRITWMVRKLSANEREWRQQQALNKDVVAMTANANNKAHVYGYTVDISLQSRFLFWLKRTFTTSAVFLSERGARQEGGPRAQVYKLEVRA